VPNTPICHVTVNIAMFLLSSTPGLGWINDSFVTSSDESFWI
jgi:hypothetical protein